MKSWWQAQPVAQAGRRWHTGHGPHRVRRRGGCMAHLGGAAYKSRCQARSSVAGPTAMGHAAWCVHGHVTISGHTAP